MSFLKDISGEFVFKTSRSSGKGGQNVNKVSTKVEVRFNVPGSVLLTDDQKETLMAKLAGRITASGDLIVTASVERSQLANKKRAVSRLLQIVEKALQVEKKRINTKKPRSAVEKRLATKKVLAERKSGRRKITSEE